MTTTVSTPFGRFEGKRSNGVVQYLGIKYAKLKDQLSAPEMVESYDEAVVDATKYGPRAVAMDGCQYEQAILIQQSIDTPPIPPISPLECLNLNITMPDVDIAKPLPVMVFIHGGGFVMGGNWWPQYDSSRLVKLSMGIDMPIIAVNIGYRLGVLGNLTSKELREAGYPGNNALRDQKCSMQWIKSHIASFSGDPDNVTVYGVSAGAASVIMQLCSKEPLFKRAISMSGTPLMLKPLTIPATEMAYDIIMKELGLDNASTKERIQRLQAIGPGELVEKTPLTVPLVPFVDNDLIFSETTFKELKHGHSPVSECQWCEDLIIGDCQHDGNVFEFMGLEQRKPGLASAFHAFLVRNLSNPTAADAVFQAYNLSTSTSDDVAMKILTEFGTDIAYYAPALVYARSWLGKSYYYHFNEPNPWDGPFKGMSTHMLDAAFLFQNYNERLSPEVCEVAVSMASDFIMFANGVAPWKEFSKGIIRTFQSGRSEKDANRLGSDRRDTLFKLELAMKIDLDELSLAWGKFLSGLQQDHPETIVNRPDD